jgi:CubicO group peptidase (beta-lactamase class C family)
MHNAVNKYIPNDLRTKFEIGSMTKQLTALLVLQFVKEGRINLLSII